MSRPSIPATANLARIRGLSLDAGHTFLFPTPSLGSIYAETARDCAGISLAPAEIERVFRAAWDTHRANREGLLYGTDDAEALRFWSLLVTTVLRDLAPEVASDGVGEKVTAVLYEEFARAPRWVLDPALIPLLEHCRHADIGIAVTSNWDIRLRGLLRALELLDKFDAAIISAERALEKPDPELFAVTAADLGVAPAEILHVGDTWSEDITGALASGMQAAWINPTGAPPPDPSLPVTSVADLGELTACLTTRHVDCQAIGNLCPEY